MAVPVDRYAMSRRSFCSDVSPWEYAPGMDVRKVDTTGRLRYKGVTWRIGKPFVGRRGGISPTTADGQFDLWYRHQWVASLDFEGP